MFRIVLMAATAVALVGCARSESATEAAFRADDAKCKEYGANPGSDAYAQCRLAIDLQKGNAEAAAARPYLSMMAIGYGPWPRASAC
jgi:hypothetical protein